MTLPKFNANVSNIQGLSDRPNTADGLTAAQLKAKFDKAGQDIKDYLNNELLPTLDKDLEKLNGSRKCNNEFDDPLIARENLKIKVVTSDSEMIDTDTIYLKYIA